MESKRGALLCALALAAPWAVGEEKGATRKTVPRVYTNEDLDRVSPRRGETGVLSRPGRTSPARDDSPPDTRTRGEEYWRREAARVTARVRGLREQAARLRERMERTALRSRPGKAQRAGMRDRWAAEDARANRLRDLEVRARDLEADLEDRARREGVPPGWIR